MMSNPNQRSEIVRDLLIEIGTEELPPKTLTTLSAALVDELKRAFAAAKLSHGEVTPYATPRRLAAWAHNLSERQPNRQQQRRGPALQAAFDDEGNPTKAAQGFARSAGVTVADLETLETDKGRWLCFNEVLPGKHCTDLLEEIINSALARLPIARRMRWGDSETEFVRPVHWVVLLFGGEIVTAEILGLSTGRSSRGHRFHHPAPISVDEPASYQMQMRQARVIVDFDERRRIIAGQIAEVAASIGGRALVDVELLDEVTALVEWPVAQSGIFDRRFLELPREVLIASLQNHQKYFPIEDSSGELIPAFVFISNLESKDPQQVQAGNEKVIRPRLEDASFFYQQDRTTGLAALREKLDGIIFQAQLGTMLEKTKRLTALAIHIGEQIGADAQLVKRAGELAKCDLLTEMVGEFPELQGTMGRYYALAENEPEAVAVALEEQYRPRYADDRLPESPTGAALAIADRLDTVAGIFSLGQRPSGDKDPFALRRAALGVLRILIEGSMDLDLNVLLEHAVDGLPASLAKRELVDEVFDFMMDRLRAYYLRRNVGPETFEAVYARRPLRPHDFDLRILAVTAFSELPEAKSLSAANKRIRNILKQATVDNQQKLVGSLLREPAEQTLAARLNELSTQVAPLFTEYRYGDALKALATLKNPVDTFFDQVMVMSDDADLRNNRLVLLNKLNELFLKVADISQLPTS
jgi:glycyl-tRNA synthetase beta chain